MPDTKRIARARNAAAKAQNWRCYWCGGQMLSWRDRPAHIPRAERFKMRVTAEHVVPTSKGGTSCRGNIVAACLKCNNGRGNAPTPERREP